MSIRILSILIILQTFYILYQNFVFIYRGHKERENRKKYQRMKEKIKVSYKLYYINSSKLYF